MLTALTDWDLVVEVLDEAQGLGLNTLRTWAFAERADGDPPDKPALTLQPGVYDETTFRGACSSLGGALSKGLDCGAHHSHSNSLHHSAGPGDCRRR